MVFPKGVGILWKYHPNSKWRKSWHFFVLKPSPRSISDKNCHHISTTVSNTLKTLQTTTGNETNTFKNNETKEMNGPRRPRKSYHPLRSRWTETPILCGGLLRLTPSLSKDDITWGRSESLRSVVFGWRKKQGTSHPQLVMSLVGCFFETSEKKQSSQVAWDEYTIDVTMWTYVPGCPAGT